jgi:LysR family transcriptional regulator, low CO2-responsive transcriptional regulator
MKACDHESMLALLWDGIVELALVTWPVADALAADLTLLFAMHEPVVLVAAPSHPLAARRRVGSDEVARLARPLYRLRWWQSHHPELDRLAARSGTNVEITMDAARHLVLAGTGAGFFTRTYIADELAHGRLVAVGVRDLAPLRRDSALVRRTRPLPLAPAATRLVEALRAQAARLGLLAPPPRRPPTGSRSARSR